MKDYIPIALNTAILILIGMIYLKLESEPIIEKNIPNEAGRYTYNKTSFGINGEMVDIFDTATGTQWKVINDLSNGSVLFNTHNLMTHLANENDWSKDLIKKHHIDWGSVGLTPRTE